MWGYCLESSRFKQKGCDQPNNTLAAPSSLLATRYRSSAVLYLPKQSVIKSGPQISMSRGLAQWSPLCTPETNSFHCYSTMAVSSVEVEAESNTSVLFWKIA